MPAPVQMTPERQALIKEVRQHIGASEFTEALEKVKPWVEKHPKDPEALLLMGLCFEGLRDLARAIEYARKSAAIYEHVETDLLVARVQRLMGNTDEVVRLCKKILAKKPGMHVPALVLGGALEEAGRFDEAREVIRPGLDAVIAQGIEGLIHAFRYEWAKLLVQEKKFEEGITEIDLILNSNLKKDDLRRQAYHLKAKACDRMKNYEAAYQAAHNANQYEAYPFSPELYEEQVSTLIEIWSRDNMARFPKSDCDSPVPVFVAGMPRSGTSLIDQIIDAHPKAAGVGELATIESFAGALSQAFDPDKDPPECFGPFQTQQWSRVARQYLRYIQRQDATAERIVNKALGNNKLVGLLACLFPKTRIIHAIRDPRDVAVSCYMGGFNNKIHAWTTRFDWISMAWQQSMRMMDHWKDVLDVPILDVHYENLVRDPDTEFPRIIEFLGLEWDDKCREFHKSRRTVRTLSYDQVNRPLYTSSAGRHVNYLEYMEAEGAVFPEYNPMAGA